MNLRNLATAVLFVVTAVAAHAQGGIYIDPIAVRVSNSVADKGTFAFLGQNSTSNVFYGVNFGGYQDFHATSNLNAGIDVREYISHGNAAALSAFLVGLRVSPSSYKHRFKPYAQGSVGLGTSRAPASAIHVSKLEYGIFGGVDYSLGRFVDFRIMEVSYSSLATASSETIGGTAAIPTSNLLGFTSGLVFRIP